MRKNSTNKIRLEQDSLGILEVPANKYWGAQTQRAKENFNIGQDMMPLELIKALAIVKKSAAITNNGAKKLLENISKAISKAADEIIKGKLDSNFPLKIWQTGSGTQTNMNINEVIANRASEILGGEIRVHPNDHVNMSQSSNDVFPTAMHISSIDVINNKLLPRIKNIIDECKLKEVEFKNIIKIGRTHLQDAVPIKLEQEFSGYRQQLQDAQESILNNREKLYELPIGGTAVGTGLNTPIDFDINTISGIADITKEPFKKSLNKFALISAHDVFVSISGAIKQLACALMKIANDIRLLASGPRTGIAEIILPSNEPGSSIMPGKVNPTQCEAMTMVCIQVLANDTAISMACSQGHLQLNVYKPLIIHNFINSINLLSDAIESFNIRCFSGIKINKINIDHNVNNSLMLVTALNVHIGYDKAAKVAKLAYDKNINLKDASLELGFLTEDEFDEWVDPALMV